MLFPISRSFPVILGMMSFLLFGAVPKVESETMASPDLLPIYSNNPIVALVDGEPIWLDELKNTQIQEMMVRLHSSQEVLLRRKVLQLLAERHPELRPKPIPRVLKSDVAKFYKTEPGIKDIGKLDQIENEIRVYLEKTQRREHLRDLNKRYELAMKKGWVVDHFGPPNDFQLLVGIGTAMLWFHGKSESESKVFFMEYSDFLCPFCKKVQRTLNGLRKRYANRVQFGYRHFPLHQEARVLSEAVECARDQNRFWQYQSAIYKNPEGLREDHQIVAVAQRAGVKNLKAFQKCLETGKYQKRIKKDYDEGLQLGIQGTPTFIIGTYNREKGTIYGEMMSGAVPTSQFVKVIEKYLHSPGN